MTKREQVERTRRACDIVCRRVMKIVEEHGPNEHTEVPEAPFRLISSIATLSAEIVSGGSVDDMMKLVEHIAAEGGEELIN